MNRFKVQVEARIHPTEDLEKVRRAIENIYSGPLSLQKIGETNIQILKGSGDDLSVLKGLKDILKRDRIRAAANAALSSGILGESLIVHLNKQVAYAKHVSFCGSVSESPLGPIAVTIEGGDLYRAVEWLTSKVEEG
ncbi:RNA-binding domain-containing protein [[Eubacterium] cellulosolvens]